MLGTTLSNTLDLSGDRCCPDEPTSFWFSPRTDERTTSPCWQDTSPLSQGLLLAGSNTPAYTGHGTLTCPQEGQEERTVVATQKSERTKNPPRVDIENHGKMSWKGRPRMSGLSCQQHSSRRGRLLLWGLKGRRRTSVGDRHLFFSPKGGC